MNIKTILDLLKETFAEWNKIRRRVGGSIGVLHSVLSGAVADYCNCDRGFGIWEEAGARVGQIQGLVGKDGAEVIQTAIENANKPTRDYRLCDQRCRPLL